MTAPYAGALDPSLASYLVDCSARGHREDTIKLRRHVMKKLSQHAGGRSLLSLTNDDLHAYFIQYRHLAPAGRRSYGAALRSFYKWAVERQLIDTDPTRGLPIPKAGHRGKPRPMSPEHLHLGLQHAGPRMRLWIMLGAGAGLRAGEIARLNREHIDVRVSPPAIDVVNGKGGPTAPSPSVSTSPPSCRLGACGTDACGRSARIGSPATSADSSSDLGSRRRATPCDTPMPRTCTSSPAATSVSCRRCSGTTP